MAVEDDVEPIPPSRLQERARDELHQVEIVARERLERAVKNSAPAGGR
jgi:hypothetical protein